ncbi:DUF934 domain-containing protein [Methylotuvimicrobium sp. KM1]|uniref:DUF934 domain-containing protein n=1 Tax=Methylotuvimicrobium sp. KM1 TaxID=3377707 RepID=UPI0038512AB7
MQIIKDKKITEDNCQFVADNQDIPQSGDITVSVSRWLNDKDSLTRRGGQTGLRIRSTDTLEDIAGDLAGMPLVELDIAMFGDGRSFSQAWLLRNRYHYRGEIRAVGNYLIDQIFYLHRTGVDAFQLDESRKPEDALAALNDFSVAYQPSVN